MAERQIHTKAVQRPSRGDTTQPGSRRGSAEPYAEATQRLMQGWRADAELGKAALGF